MVSLCYILYNCSIDNSYGKYKKLLTECDPPKGVGATFGRNNKRSGQLSWFIKYIKIKKGNQTLHTYNNR